MRIARAIAFAILLSIVTRAVTVCAAVPMGPAVATLDEEQWAFGLEYGRAETSLQAQGAFITKPDGGDATYAYERMGLDELTSDMVMATLAYGICDNWDVYLRLGLADARGDVAVRTAADGGAPQRSTYGGGHGFAYGIGTRATVCRWGPWSFGGLAQVTWLDPDGDDFVARDPEAANTIFTGCIDIDAWQAQVALAAVYQIDTLHFWTGPFLQFTEGHYDRNGEIFVDEVRSGTFRASGDIEEASRVGVHCGVTWEASPRFHYHMEGQFASDSWLFGLGLTFTPERLFGDL